jgi:hypothetical protein
MASQTRKKLSKPVMVRMDHDMKEDIERIAAANDLTGSDVIRLAMRKGLPGIRSALKAMRAS